MTDGRLDGWMDRRVDSWTDGRPRRAGWRTRAGRPNRAGKTGRDGRTDREDKTETGYPSMNAARGRRPTNARSTKIRRSVD